MSLDDAERWNERYRNGLHATFEAPRPFLLECSDYLPTQGLALDIAMGLGGNAGFLLGRGLKVMGVDISEVAVRRARRRYPELMAFLADLNHLSLPQQRFDVILNFFYLQRRLWAEYERALRPGGVLVFETLTLDMRQCRPDIDPTYLLAPGELQGAFPGLETVVYREGWGVGGRGLPRATASLLARKSS